MLPKHWSRSWYVPLWSYKGEKNFSHIFPTTTSCKNFQPQPPFFQIYRLSFVLIMHPSLYKHDSSSNWHGFELVYYSWNIFNEECYLLCTNQSLFGYLLYIIIYRIENCSPSLRKIITIIKSIQLYVHKTLWMNQIY